MKTTATKTIERGVDVNSIIDEAANSLRSIQSNIGKRNYSTAAGQLEGLTKYLRKNADYFTPQISSVRISDGVLTLNPTSLGFKNLPRYSQVLRMLNWGDVKGAIEVIEEWMEELRNKANEQPDFRSDKVFRNGRFHDLKQDRLMKGLPLENSR